MKNKTDRSPLGQFEVTDQLLTLIDGLSKEKQFILLKQLLGSNLSVHLMRMVIDMSESQRVELLKALGEGPAEKDAVTTINLDDSNNLMRGNVRQECHIAARLKTAEGTHECTIVDISTFGVFVRSHTRHTTGKTIQLDFTLPNSKMPFCIEGKIVRSTPSGVGVRFQDLTTGQFEAIKQYCETPTAPPKSPNQNY